MNFFNVNIGYIYFTALLLINIFSFFIMHRDKVNSVNRKDNYRIPEGLMFFLVSIFGGLGIYTGMFIFRHKTRKWYFQIGVPSFKEKIIDDKKSFINDNSLFVQNIVSHIENPTPHIKITACITERTDFAIVDTINQITLNENYNPKVFWLLLNSRLVNWYVYRFILGKAIRTIHFDNSLTARIPISQNIENNQKRLIEKADIMLELNKKFHEQSSRFLQRMIDNYELEKPNKKLKKFWELDFGDFVREMRKKGATVALSTQDELQDYFEKNKSELLELDTQIKSTDAEIDTMVYELYGLNDEEIKIIENS